MTPGDRKILAATPSNASQSIGPNAIGEAVWGSGRPMGNCSAPFARPAGKALRRLMRDGYVERPNGWRRTKAGDAFLVDAGLANIAGVVL